MQDLDEMQDKAVETEKAVEAREISKVYRTFSGKETVILKDINLDIGQDEIFGILGPNGSGKTTLISILSTLIYPDKGRFRILGHDWPRETETIRKLINISTAKPNFPWSLSVKENLRYSGMLYGMYGSDLERSVEEQMSAFELNEYANQQFENLSTGLKQRLSLAKAMLNSPRLLFLDEPTTGLDPEIAMKTRSLIMEIHQENKVSIVITTHYMPEAEMLCDRIAFLRRGEIVALDTPQNLKNALKLGERIIIKYEGSVDLVSVENMPGVMSIRASPGQAEIVMDRSYGTMGSIIKIFSEAEITDIGIKEPDLEDVFLELAR
jgi:ABC-2 type transport system ATP-binding protein